MVTELKTNNMGFKLKSGNTTSFKTMGGTEKSPAKHGTTDDFLYGRNGHNPDIMEGKHEDWHTDKIEAEKKKPEKKKPSPAKDIISRPNKPKDTTPPLLASPNKQYENPSDRKRETPGQYWYAINNRPATKAEYIKYQNKPGGDEPGKQTNDPDVYGRNKTK